MNYGGMMRRMLRLRVLARISMLLALLSCASDPPPPPLQLNFIDSKLFDDQLHDALAAEPSSVTVNFTGQDVTVNRIPERLDVWLYLLVDRYEGKIQMTPDPSAAMGKGLEGLAVGLVMGAYEFGTERLFHRPIQFYDATVYFIPASGALTRVVFQRKPKT
jgi:hypothetical protein